MSYLDSRGYPMTRLPAGDPRGRRIPIHRLVAEKALGRPLTKAEVVHHINGIKTDNRPANLLICSASYHRLIHHRERALKACGNANWWVCQICKQYGDPSLFYPRGKGSGGAVTHRVCARRVRIEYGARKRAERRGAA